VTEKGGTVGGRAPFSAYWELSITSVRAWASHNHQGGTTYDPTVEVNGVRYIRNVDRNGFKGLLYDEATQILYVGYYVANYVSRTIRINTKEGVKSTWDQYSYYDDVSGPMALDAEKQILYVADSNYYVIYQVSLTSGEISPTAGQHGVQGNVDGPLPESSFNGDFRALAFDASRNCIYVGEGASVVRKIDLTVGVVTTLVGSGMTSIKDFSLVDGRLYIADYEALRVLSLSTGVVSTILTETGQDNKVLSVFVNAQETKASIVNTIRGGWGVDYAYLPVLQEVSRPATSRTQPNRRMNELALTLLDPSISSTHSTTYPVSFAD